MAVILPDVPNVVKIIIKGVNQTHPFINTFFLQHGALTMDQAAMNAIAVAANSAYWSAFQGGFMPSVNSVLAEAIDLSTRTGFFGTDSTPHVGTGTGTQAAPVSVAVCMSWIINDRYRGGHPRMYLPAPDNGTIQGGNTWNAGALASMRSAAAAFHSNLNGLTTAGTSWQHVAVRYYKDKQLLTTPLVRLVTGTTVRSRIDSMRRRTGKETA